LGTIHLLLAKPLVASDPIIKRLSAIKWIHIIHDSIAP